MTKIDWSFPKQVLIALVVTIILGAYPLATYGDREIVKAAITGAALTTINVLLGYAAIELSFGKSAATFFKYVLGGMGIRMLFMAGILAVLIKIFDFNVAALIASMGLLYVEFLTLEILYIQKKVHTRQEN